MKRTLLVAALAGAMGLGAISSPAFADWQSYHHSRYYHSDYRHEYRHGNDRYRHDYRRDHRSYDRPYH